MSPDPRDRRTFLKQSAAAASALALGCAPEGAERASGTAAPPPLPREPLRAVAATVLPSEVGPEGPARIADEFEAWLAGYAPVSEQVHGYGTQEIRYGPPAPGPRWSAQLEALDSEARARHGRPFASLAPAERRALLETALAQAEGGLADRPAALTADHVAVGLLSFFYGSPEAADLCYGRRIGAGTCRPLEASGERPERLDVEIAARPSSRPPAPRSESRGTRIERGLEPAS